MRTCVVVGCAWVALLMGCEPDCSEGRQGTGGHCCWPGQHWSDEREACQGTPACPQGKVAAGGGCTGPTPKCPDGMVGIGEARFYVGTDKEPRPGGTPPLTEVHTDAFCIDKYEVTVAQYRECVEAGKCAEPKWEEDLAGHKECTWTHPDLDDYPINCITPGEAATYCSSRGAQLATQLQWQLGALGLGAQRYPWGDDPPSPKRGNFAGIERVPPGRAMFPAKDSWPATAPVRAMGGDRSPFGVVGTASNVSEWVEHCRPFNSAESPDTNIRKGANYLTEAGRRLDLRGTTRDVAGIGPSVGLRCATLR